MKYLQHISYVIISILFFACSPQVKETSPEQDFQELDSKLKNGEIDPKEFQESHSKLWEKLQTTPINGGMDNCDTSKTAKNINFEHKLHKTIDCKICHSQIDGKTQLIPSSSACLNCHQMEKLITPK